MLSGSLLAQCAPTSVSLFWNPFEHRLGTRWQRRGGMFPAQQIWDASCVSRQTWGKPARANQPIAHKTVNNMPIRALFPAPVLHCPLGLSELSTHTHLRISNDLMSGPWGCSEIGWPARCSPSGSRVLGFLRRIRLANMRENSNKKKKKKWPSNA